jgi:hypothetical protein
VLTAIAAALKASAPAAISDAFVQTRLTTPHGAVYGSAVLDARIIDSLLQRALPEA